MLVLGIASKTHRFKRRRRQFVHTEIGRGFGGCGTFFYRAIDSGRHRRSGVDQFHTAARHAAELRFDAVLPIGGSSNRIPGAASSERCSGGSLGCQRFRGGLLWQGRRLTASVGVLTGEPKTHYRSSVQIASK